MLPICVRRRPDHWRRAGDDRRYDRRDRSDDRGLCYWMGRSAVSGSHVGRHRRVQSSQALYEGSQEVAVKFFESTRRVYSSNCRADHVHRSRSKSQDGLKRR